MTASTEHRRRRTIALAGQLAIVFRWAYRLPDPDPERAAAGYAGPPVHRVLIACRACGVSSADTREGPVLRAWTEHVAAEHPALLEQVPYAKYLDRDRAEDGTGPQH